MPNDSSLAKVVTNIDELKAHIAAERAAGRTIVFTNGCFDILHAGHVMLLNKAGSSGDCLIVAVNSDESVHRLKGAGRPIFSEDHRLLILASLRAVDYVVAFDDLTPAALIEVVCPDILIKGEDYRDREVSGSEFVVERGGKLLFVPLVPQCSSTQVIERIRAPINEQQPWSNGRQTEGNRTDETCDLLQEDRDVVIATLDAQFSRLEQIKQREFAWLTLYSLLISPVIALFSATTIPADDFIIPCIAVLSFMAATAWVQDLLCDERRAYYFVLRMVLRLQNYLGLLRHGIMSDKMIDSAFPRGYGIFPDRDGTNPQKYFYHIQFAVLFLFSLLAVASTWKSVLPFYASLVPIGLDLAWVVYLIRKDKVQMAKAVEVEASLTGNDPRWFPGGTDR